MFGAEMSAVRTLYVVLFSFLHSGGAAGFVPDKEALHEYMTADELGLFFGVGAQVHVPDYEVVFLRSLPVLSDSASPDGDVHDQELHYDFAAFGRQVMLRLRPNMHLIAPNFRSFRHSDYGIDEVPGSVPRCHYLQHDDKTVAAVSLCQDRTLHGFVMLDNDTLEIRPLTPRLHTLLLDREALEGNVEGSGIPHIVRRAPLISNGFYNDAVFVEALEDNLKDIFQHEGKDSRRWPRSAKKFTLEAALFFDEAGYKIFAPYFQNDDKQLRDMLLAYMNGVQALYHHPSLGQSVDIVLVRLDIFKRQPADLDHYGGERGKLLDSFCNYNKNHNPQKDSNSDHWDIGLYVSGLDFFAYENGRKSGVTMGLATVGGICLEQYNCVIAELGTTNVFGKPYPSAGFTSVYVLAHEIGHNLGMHHDGVNNNCPKEGFIMSPSRGTVGETLWSTCSAEVMKKIGSASCLSDVPKAPPADRDHSRYLDEPGQAWGAKRQCEILLRDKDATLQNPDNLQDICQNLRCRTPHRSGFYFAGPALEGTTCGNGKWCQGGECVVSQRKKPQKVVKGGWSEWRNENCASGCIEKSRGHQRRSRSCDNPKPVNTEEGCEGPSFDVVLCKDEKCVDELKYPGTGDAARVELRKRFLIGNAGHTSITNLASLASELPGTRCNGIIPITEYFFGKLCKKSKRKTAQDYATAACEQFSKLLPELDPQASGLQAPHEEARMWMGCAIFCRRKDTGSFYTPRLDLNDMGVNPYFPDGTWCHNDGKLNYYCIQHHCLPETFRLGKSVPFGSGDVPIPQNAPPRPFPLPDDVLRYLSLGMDGRPLLTTLKPDTSHGPHEDEWANKDYIELPKTAAEEEDSV